MSEAERCKVRIANIVALLRGLSYDELETIEDAAYRVKRCGLEPQLADDFGPEEPTKERTLVSVLAEAAL